MPRESRRSAARRSTIAPTVALLSVEVTGKVERQAHLSQSGHNLPSALKSWHPESGRQQMVPERSTLLPVRLE